MSRSWSLGLLAATFLTSAAFGQQVPPLELQYAIQACRNMLHGEVENSLGSAGYANQWQAKANELTAKVAELEAKLKEADAAAKTEKP
jgi:hypothetical protein